MEPPNIQSKQKKQQTIEEVIEWPMRNHVDSVMSSWIENFVRKEV